MNKMILRALLLVSTLVATGAQSLTWTSAVPASTVESAATGGLTFTFGTTTALVGSSSDTMTLTADQTIFTTDTTTACTVSLAGSDISASTSCATVGNALTITTTANMVPGAVIVVVSDNLANNAAANTVVTFSAVSTTDTVALTGETGYTTTVIATCTAADTPYTGCTVPGCTTNATTPYAGCDNACTTNATTPYDGCTVTACTANATTPYAGCDTTCTNVTTPYANCTVPICTAADTPYAGCTCRSGTWSVDGTSPCEYVPAGSFASINGTYADRGATNTTICPAGKFNVNDTTTNLVSGDCGWCQEGTEFKGSDQACGACPVGKYQSDNYVASVSCRSCEGNRETQSENNTYVATGATRCQMCGVSDTASSWECKLSVCHCDNGPAAVGAACPSTGEEQCADLSCLHPDVTVHVLKRSTVFNVNVGELQPGDLVIGEDGTSTVQRVERFSVSDKGCVVPHDLCKEQLRTKIVLSRNHAVRCPEWPLDNWMFCQDEWERESVQEYVHVELENYMSDHLLSDAVVLESWDGYRRQDSEVAESCTVGCPWPHDWKRSSLDSRKHVRVDLRKPTTLDTRRMHSTKLDTRTVRDGRKVSERGLKILRSYLKK